MSLLDHRARQVDAADLVVMASVETVQDQMQPASASAVASLIGGAPEREVGLRLYRLHHLGLLDELNTTPNQYRVTLMGAELLARELVGWSPSALEQRRRDRQALSAVVGALRRS
jgi:RIO-like serine/threonine protein kinase